MAMIDIGKRKQLFFDDYLIESLTNAKQGLNPAVKVDDNPILQPERPWEGNYMRPIKVIFDETAQTFKMWYTASTTTVRLENGVPVPGGPAGLGTESRGNVMCLATSDDGVHWERPSLGLVAFEGSTDNNILPERENRPTAPDFQDLHEKDAGKRYKALRMTGGTQTRGMQYDLFYSPDALDWTPYEGNPVIDTGQELGRWAGRFQGWDPIRQTYYVTMEASHHWRGPYGKRLVGRAESPDMIHWTEPEIILVPDENDFPDTEFYSMPVIAYEGVYVGLLWIFRTTNVTHHPEVVFSRDGFHFQRNYREPFIPRGGARADFDSSSVYAQDIIVHGNRILTYYIGTNSRSPEIALELGDKSTEGIGLAISRLDGFVSLDGGKGWVVTDRSEDELQHIPGERQIFNVPASFSQMVTRPFGFSGSRLHLNASMAPIAAGPGPGEVRVEILRANHKKLPGLTFDDADPITTSSLAHVVSWNGSSDVSALAGESIKLRFYFKNAKLYSFQFK
ncbi:MAG: hypothetical protein O7E52_25860 [Candidatus Poribacteria bacterium]|nr:hypothetical protein [Candidatus Poribacteria bacterium]